MGFRKVRYPASKVDFVGLMLLQMFIVTLNIRPSLATRNGTEFVFGKLIALFRVSAKQALPR